MTTSTRDTQDTAVISPTLSGTDSSTDTKKRRPRTKASLREQKKASARKLILDSAQHLINDKGYANTKMRDVAAQAEMSYQTLYNYFPTKGLILQELLTRDLVKLRRATLLTLEGDGVLNDKLRELAKTYIDAIAPTERELWREVSAELLKVTSHHSCVLDLIDHQALLKLEDAFSRAQKTNELDPHIESDTLATIVFSLLDANLMRYLVNQNLTRTNMMSALSAQLRLTITPHLRRLTPA